MNFALYFIVILVAFVIGYTMGYAERPATVPCEVEIPSFTKGVTAFRLTTCTLRKE